MNKQKNPELETFTILNPDFLVENNRLLEERNVNEENGSLEENIDTK